MLLARIPPRQILNLSQVKHRCCDPECIDECSMGLECSQQQELPDFRFLPPKLGQ